jgi:hypothetical protein
MYMCFVSWPLQFCSLCRCDLLLANHFFVNPSFHFMPSFHSAAGHSWYVSQGELWSFCLFLFAFSFFLRSVQASLSILLFTFRLFLSFLVSFFLFIFTSRKKGFHSPLLVPNVFGPRLKGSLVPVHLKMWARGH